MNICFTASIIVVISFFFGWTLMTLSPRLRNIVMSAFENYQNFVKDIQNKKETTKHETKKRK